MTCSPQIAAVAQTSPLERAIAAAGGPSALGRNLGISHAAVIKWKRCPAERVLAVEAASGGAVSKEELRPDLYPPPTGDRSAAA